MEVEVEVEVVEAESGRAESRTTTTVDMLSMCRTDVECEMWGMLGCWGLGEGCGDLGTWGCGQRDVGSGIWGPGQDSFVFLFSHLEGCCYSEHSG